MEQIEDQTIIIEKNGKEVKCDLVFTFDSPDTGKVYMAYTDYSKDEQGNNNLYVYSFDPILEKIEMVTDEAEVKMTNEVIQEIRKEMYQ